MPARKLFNSFGYAIAGILYALRTQRNMRIHFAAALAVLLLSLFFNLPAQDILFLFFAVTLVIMAEMFNTAIEATVDLHTRTYHPMAKIAKNVAAGAVLVTACNALLVAYVIFYPHLSLLPSSLVRVVHAAPTPAVLAVLLLVAFLVLAVKALAAQGARWYGRTCGYSAFGFAAATMVVLLVPRVLILSLVLFLAALVVYSRLEAGLRSAGEVLSGAVLGILVAVALFKVLHL